MDYEQKYKEALERAKKLKHDVETIGCSMAPDTIEIIFPELKETEDERIRNRIAKSLACGLRDGMIDDKENEECLAWLEKQKEQKPVEIHIDNPNIQKYDDVKISTSDSSASGDELLYVCNKSYNIGFRDGVASVKPAEHPEKGNEYWFGFNEGKGTVLDNPEQFGLYKPAEWSEEDRKMLDAIIKRYSFPIETDFSVFVGEDNLKDMREELGWLKSLRPQSKAELTLLDQNIISAAVAFVEQNNHFNCWRGIDKHTVIKALRSLKPHWKPSKEQIQALTVAIDGAARCEDPWWKDSLHDVLLSLHTDLQKLL